jgi:dTDP-4-amino-4,6-dideoxygalactose transaminase
MMLQANETVQTSASPPPRPVVPFLDLKAQYAPLREEMVQAVTEVMDSTTYVLGPKVAAFEEAFAAYVGAKHAIGVNTGTSALHLALICAGVGPGDEVITVPMTFIATSWAISYCGASPVFVDVDAVTYTMDPSQVEKKITPKTKAILPVHLYGQPADLKPLLEIGKRHGIPVIEDCAQSHGAKYYDRNVGTFGKSGCFSFYPGKNLGAYGEGGAIVTNDDAIAARMRALRDHAQEKRYHHQEIGFNYRMDSFQGAVLGIKLRHIEKWSEARSAAAENYKKLLAGLPLQAPVQAPGRRSVWHLYVVLHPQRDRLQKELQARNVHTGLHYPIPLHLQKAYKHLGYQAGDFPVSERVGRECLSLPMFPELTGRQQEAVADALEEALREVAK